VSATGERKWEITCACSWQATRMLAVSIVLDEILGTATVTHRESLTTVDDA
jgi:hypothetical protein